MESSEDSDVEMVQTSKDVLNEDEENHVITEDVIINGKSNVAGGSSKTSSRASSIKSLNSNSSSSNKKEPDVIEDVISMAEQAEYYKNEGNNSYKNGNYRESIEFYSKAIDLCPKNAAYYGNRAAAYLMLNNYKETIEDAKKSTSLDDKFVKVNIILF